MIRKKLLLIVSGFLTAFSVSAQYRSEISVDLFGGLSSLAYKTEPGDKKNGPGGGAGVTYRYLFSPKSGVGIQTGLNVALMNATADMGNTEGVQPAFDGEEDFEFRYKLNSWEEKQQVIMVNVPVMLYLESGYDNRFYLAAGGKVGIPVSSKTKTSGELKTAGYYEYMNALLEEPEFMGFGTFSYSGDKDLKLKPSICLSVETGMKWKIKIAKKGNLARRTALTTALYFDYGLNNIKKSETYNDLIAYDWENPTFPPNSIFASNYTGDGETVKIAEKLRPFALGLKVSLNFGLGERYRREHYNDWLWP